MSVMRSMGKTHPRQRTKESKARTDGTSEEQDAIRGRRLKRTEKERRGRQGNSQKTLTKVN